MSTGRRPSSTRASRYGSAPEITYLLRESARTAAGELIPDGHGGWVKTYRLLDGAAEMGPDGVARGSLPSYADVLVNNGVSRDAIDQLLADVAAWQDDQLRGLDRTQVARAASSTSTISAPRI